MVDNDILSALAKIDKLDLLNEAFESVGTTSFVLEEVNKDVIKGYDFVEEINKIKSYKEGWLTIISPTEEELEKAEEILQPSISFVDSVRIAVAKNKGERFLTDDRNAGGVASRNSVEVWDFKLFIEYCIKKNLVESSKDLKKFLKELEEKDYYRFSSEDREDLFDLFS